MKYIYIILFLGVIVFSSCETDFDVNSEWEELTVIYGLLDLGIDTQSVKISKAFLGEMDAFDMAQYSDSINYEIDDLDIVKVYKWGDNGIEDSVNLNPVPTVRNTGDFNDSIIVYEFVSQNFLNKNYKYEIVCRNKQSKKITSSEKTRLVSGFSFEMPNNYQFGFIGNFNESSPDAVEFSSSSVQWDKFSLSNNSSALQLDLIFKYNENQIEKDLIFTQPLVDVSEGNIRIDGDDFFIFLSNNLEYDVTKTRYFTGIDLVVTVASEDLQTYINVNRPITGIAQQRPQFTNINNGIGLFSSRLTIDRSENDGSGFKLATSSEEYLKSPNGLNRNFK